MLKIEKVLERSFALQAFLDINKTRLNSVSVLCCAVQCHVCVCVCVCACVCLCVLVCAYVCMCMYVYVCVYMSI